MIRDKILDSIEKAVKDLQKEKKFSLFDIPAVKIEYSESKAHGDYAAGIAMKIAKIVKKNPMEIADLLVSKIESYDSGLFEKIEAVKPGFINFFVASGYLQEQISKILKEKDKFGQLEIGKGKKVQVEFISANPTGPLTIGNARGGPFGDVLANVFKKAGFKTEKAYYINDYGMQILTLGHSVLKDEEAKYKGEYIDNLNKVVKEKDPYKAGEKAAEIILKGIKKTVEKLGIKFDEWVSEKSFHESGEVDKVIGFLKDKGLTYEKEGALWFKSSDYGDTRDRVLVKSDGEKTYLAGDIAHHKYKFEKKKFDKVINVWGADHHGDVPSLLAGVEALGYKGKLNTVLLQFITLFEGKKKLKMSKRAGTYVTMDELLDEVGSDIVRFFFLQRSSDRHLNFDLSLAKEQSEKNPVYYVQYAYARMCSILRKSGKGVSDDFSLLKHKSELGLIKHLIRFPEVIEDVVVDYQVQRIPSYVVDLAKAFHSFYRDCRVLEEDEDLKKARIALVLASKNVLKNSFDLIGVSAPERM